MSEDDDGETAALCGSGVIELLDALEAEQGRLHARITEAKRELHELRAWILPGETAPRFRILWPEAALVSADEIGTWYSDACASGALNDVGSLDDPGDQALALHHAGLIRFAVEEGASEATG